MRLQPSIHRLTALGFGLLLAVACGDDATVPSTGGGEPEIVEAGDPGPKPEADTAGELDVGIDGDAASADDVADIVEPSDPGELPDLPTPPDPGPPVGCTSDEACPGESICAGGDCVPTCSLEAAAVLGYGCRYFAVDLENVAGDGSEISPQDSVFGVTVVNPSTTLPVTVTAHEEADGPVIGTFSFDIGPGGHQVIPLGVRNVNGTLKAKLAYEIKGSRPFVMVQANPLNLKTSTTSNDISRVYPATATSHEFVAVTGRFNGFVTVVGTLPGTTVSVRPAGDIAPGGGIKAMDKGKLYSISLEPGEVLNLRAAQSDTDLSGTEVFASLPVQVFSGSVLSRTSDACCADHLEQALPPISAWGDEVLATRAAPRGAAPDYWRVVSGEDGVEVTFSPAVHPPVTLGRGEWVELTAATNFVVKADGPILAVQLLASAHEGTLQGRFCQSDIHCPQGQQCVVLESGVGRCFTQCKVQKDNCPSPVFTCHDRSGDIADFAPGEGLCHRNSCDFDDPPCPVGSVCVNGAQANICYEPCNVGEPCKEDGAGCGLLESQTVCAPPTCTVADQGEACLDKTACGFDQPVQECATPVGATCEVVKEITKEGKLKPHCQWPCDAAQVCPVPDYKCLSSKLWASGQKPFKGDICVPPVCNVDADCPAGHLCDFDFQADPPFHCKPVGDPAMLIATPVAQWTPVVDVVVPLGYRFDWVNIAAHSGASVQLDGVPVQPLDFEPVGDDYKVIRLPVADGIHRITSTHPIAVTSYGFDDEASYGTVAGGALRALSEDTGGPDPESDAMVQDGGAIDTNEPEDTGGEVVELGPPTWNDDVHPILNLRCGPCHIDGGDSGDLNFDSFAGVQGNSVACDGALTVEAIVLKVKTPNPCDGTVMPPVGDLLPIGEVKTLEEWLASGALESAPEE